MCVPIAERQENGVMGVRLRLPGLFGIHFEN